MKKNCIQLFNLKCIIYINVLFVKELYEKIILGKLHLL